jgi:hypothetical protein
MTIRYPTLLGFVVVAALTAEAQAQIDRPAEEPDDAPAKASVVPLPLRFEHGMMMAAVSEVGLTPGLMSNALVLLGPIELGLAVAGENAVFRYNRTQYGLLGGVRVRLGNTELDLAGTAGMALLGATGYSDEEIDPDDPDFVGPVYYVGARMGATFPLFVSKRGQVRLGLLFAVTYERDLDASRVRRSETGRELIAANRIGAERMGLQAAFVFGLD